MSEFEHHFFSLISQSRDGYGLFDKNDVLLYGNGAFHDLLFTCEDDVGNTTFEQIMRRNFEAKRGVNISSGNIEQFVDYVHSVRRSTPYRLFEVDSVDKRWLLFTEQSGPDGELLMQMTDITKQKVTESDLLSRINKYQQLALTDELTGIPNRRAFKDTLNAEISRLTRTSGCATLLVLDLDHFKRVNDTFGHNAGDLALAHSAKVMKSCIRPSDTIGRLGGEEFAVFLADADTQCGLDVSSRLLETIECTPLRVENHTISLTVSIGLSTMQRDLSFATLYETADQALYQAKSKGRNQVCIYQNNWI